jgi:predicted RNA-binding Zn-ribbon protein involved in translation (DUF1610 family)
MMTRNTKFQCTECGFVCTQETMLADCREDASNFGCPACGKWHPGVGADSGWRVLDH